MASYKVHTSFGAIAGVVLVVLALVYFAIPTNTLLLYIFLATIIGAFLPDLDSDSGMPFQVIFGLFGLLVAGLALYITLQILPDQYIVIGIIVIATFCIARFGMGKIFKECTRHRGIFHSIPAASIALFGMLVLLNMFDIEFIEKILIAFSVGIGYIVHLILDEIYATVNLHGKKFRPNRSLGSALKLWSSSWFVSLVAYAVLICLAYIGIMGV